MHKRLRILSALSLPLGFAGLLFLLWRGLYLQPDILPSTLIGKPLPAFRLVNLMAPTYPFTEQNLKGQVAILNIWASWCTVCQMEHPLLIEISQRYSIPIYGIAYKDKPAQISAFLQQLGNPFTMLGDDRNGEVSMDLGVYGTPETFIIDKHGKVVYRHVGLLDRTVLEKEILPLVQALQ